MAAGYRQDVMPNFNKMKLLDKFLRVERKNRSKMQILMWWELRRIPYNILVGIAGYISMSVMESRFEPKFEGEDVVEPISIFAFVILINACYTLGWISETARDNDETYGPRIYKIGLFSTIILALFPMILDLLLN